MQNDPRPFLVLTVVLDASARPASLTRSHGDALERAIVSTAGEEIAGLDLVELPIAPKPFAALRNALSVDPETVGLYNLFPLASHLEPTVRKVAGQFLAAEALWALEEQGLLSSVPLNVKLNLPSGWQRDPKQVHERLVKAGALELSGAGIETFKRAKRRWDTSAAS